MKECSVCGTEDTFSGHPGGDPSTETRPYGPGGTLVCYSCAFASPAATEQTEQAFDALLSAAQAVSPVGSAVFGDGHDGPTPFDPDGPHA